MSKNSCKLYIFVTMEHSNVMWPCNRENLYQSTNFYRLIVPTGIAHLCFDHHDHLKTASFILITPLLLNPIWHETKCWGHSTITLVIWKLLMNNDVSTPIGVSIESKTNMVCPAKHTEKQIIKKNLKALLRKLIKTVFKRS